MFLVLVQLTSRDKPSLNHTHSYDILCPLTYKHASFSSDNLLKLWVLLYANVNLHSVKSNLKLIIGQKWGSQTELMREDTVYIGAREIEFGSADGEHSGIGFVKISKNSCNAGRSVR